MSEWVDVTSERMRDLTAPPVAHCNRCQRAAWQSEQVGTEDRMTQPDGNPCGGRFVADTPREIGS